MSPVVGGGPVWPFSCCFSPCEVSWSLVVWVVVVRCVLWVFLCVVPVDVVVAVVVVMVIVLVVVVVVPP